MKNISISVSIIISSIILGIFYYYVQITKQSSMEGQQTETTERSKQKYIISGEKACDKILDNEWEEEESGGSENISFYLSTVNDWCKEDIVKETNKIYK